jgi:hypothetical protein
MARTIEGRRMNHWKGLGPAGLLAVALLAGRPAHAQAITADDVVSTRDGEIVVTARPDPAPEVSQAKSQARDITDASNIFDEPLPLFQDKVCPGVSGLPVDLAEYIADRIRFNAKRVGLRLAKAGECSPNLLVAFVLDGQKALVKYADKGNTILANVPVVARRQMIQDPGPVHAFVVAQDRTHTGGLPNFDPKQQYEVVKVEQEHSLFLLPTRSDIQMSIMLINIPAIDGMSAKQLADYATMRGLARTKPAAGDSTYSTILTLFDPDSGHPAELTNFDLGYLRSLYSNSPNIAGVAKLGGVKFQMRKLQDAAERSDN